MAEGSGDWTAGITAIAAAFLIGGGLVGAAYFGAYTPKKEERLAAQSRLDALAVDEANAQAALTRMRALEDEGEEVAAKLGELEVAFADGSAAEQDVPIVRAKITRLCKKHNLGFHDARKQQRNVEMVWPAQREIEFESGLKATGIVIEAKGTFHDFGRFLRDLEMMDQNQSDDRAMVIVEAVDCVGDNNGKREHNFTVQAFVVEKRNLETVGREGGR